MVVGSLAGFSDPRNGEVLISALKDNESMVRIAAAASLGRIGWKGAVVTLTEMLVQETPSERMAAADALGAIGDEKAVEPLIRALADQDSAVRTRAARALEAIDSPAGGAALEAAAERRDLIIVAGSYRYFIRKGIYEDVLILVMDASEDSFFATACLNSHNLRLMEKAKEWARRRGYAIIQGGGDHARWGSAQK